MTAFSSARSGVGPYDKWTDFYGTVLREAVSSADNQILVAAANFLTAGDSIVIGAAHDSPVTATIDSISGTIITLTDNVGADFAVNSPVTALPSSASAPTGAAGGDLSGTYPNPTVKNDSHEHTDTTVTPAGIGAADDEHDHDADYSATDHDHDADYDASGAATTAVSTHAGLADPHTGYVLESLVDAAGDLVLGSADNTVARLAKGSNYQKLEVNGSGVVGWTSRSGWELARSTDQSIPSATDTAITFPTETTDTDSFHVANASAITIPAGMGGWYSISAYANFDTASTSGQRVIGLWKNGSTKLAEQQGPQVTNANGKTVYWVGKLAAGETVEAYVNTGAGTPNVNPANFNGVFLGL